MYHQKNDNNDYNNNNRSHWIFIKKWLRYKIYAGEHFNRPEISRNINILWLLIKPKLSNYVDGTNYEMNLCTHSHAFTSLRNYCSVNPPTVAMRDMDLANSHKKICQLEYLDSDTIVNQTYYNNASRQSFVEYIFFGIKRNEFLTLLHSFLRTVDYISETTIF